MLSRCLCQILTLARMSAEIETLQTQQSLLTIYCSENVWKLTQNGQYIICIFKHIVNVNNLSLHVS